VLESEQPTQAQVTPAELTMPLGTEQRFVVYILDQFSAPLDSCENLYRATEVGDHQLVYPCFGMTDTAIVHVLAFDQVNLALGKPATASGAEGDGTSAAKAVDGNLTTRWSSRFQDNEWIAVDLGTCYRLTTVRLLWEAAYATAYDIQLSDDGEQYTTAKSVTGAKGGTQEIDIRRGGEAVEARYVRILCRTRNTGYGSSLWELEVYGSGLCDDPATAVSQPQTPNTVYKFIKDGKIYISRNGIVYTVDGMPCMQP